MRQVDHFILDEVVEFLEEIAAVDHYFRLLISLLLLHFHILHNGSGDLNLRAMEVLVR